MKIVCHITTTTSFIKLADSRLFTLFLCIKQIEPHVCSIKYLLPGGQEAFFQIFLQISWNAGRFYWKPEALKYKMGL